MNATCYHTRGYPLVEQMRADVAAGAIGEVAFVHGRYLCDDVLFPASGWRIDPVRSGPSYVVGDLGTHWLDLAEHVTGLHVTEVLADFRSFAGGPLEDYAALLLRSATAARPARSCSRQAQPAARTSSSSSARDEAAGSPGTRSCRPRCCVRPVDAARASSSRTRLTNAEPARRLSRYPAGHGEGYGQAFRNLFADVYAAIAGKPHAPFPTFRDGHRGVATVEAAVASARAAPGSASARRARRRPGPNRSSGQQANASAISVSDAASSSVASAFTSGVIPNLTCV